MPSKAKPSARPNPKWVAETPSARKVEWDGPDPPAYELALFNNGREDQYIKLSRKEYVALKAHLATLRGYVDVGK